MCKETFSMKGKWCQWSVIRPTPVAFQQIFNAFWAKPWISRIELTSVENLEGNIVVRNLNTFWAKPGYRKKAAYPEDPYHGRRLKWVMSCPFSFWKIVPSYRVDSPKVPYIFRLITHLSFSSPWRCRRRLLPSPWSYFRLTVQCSYHHQVYDDLPCAWFG